MVTVILSGGLGNQLFQYATGRAHSLRTNSDLYVDISWYGEFDSTTTERSVHLDAFDLSVEFVEHSSESGLTCNLRERIPQIVADNVSKRLSTRLFRVYHSDESLRFDSRVLELPGDVTLSGHWQSERYFSDIADELRKEISVSTPLRGKNRQWYEHINKTDSVSVHVRLGDYVPKGRALPVEYYRNAIKRIHRETGATSLYFFSTDIDWVCNHSQDILPDHKGINANYIDCNDGDTAYEDLRLMRSCDHHVIANSSFSWWGAWLDKSETKQIVAPDYWIRAPVACLDIVPDRWTTINY